MYLGIEFEAGRVGFRLGLTARRDMFSQPFASVYRRTGLRRIEVGPLLLVVWK